MIRRLAALAFIGIAAVFMLPDVHRQTLLPRPISEHGEDEDFAQRRSTWIEQMHAHSVGVDWRAQDAATRRALVSNRTKRAAAWRNGGPSLQPVGAPVGVWRERGALNQAGRVSDADYDAATGRVTAFAHGGQLWQSSRTALNWRPLNDARGFEPYQRMQHFVRLGGSSERLIAADDTQHAIFYSDDNGATWSRASGFAPPDWFETIDLVARDAAGSQVYALISSYDFDTTTFAGRLLVSADRGASFADLGFLEQSAWFGNSSKNEQIALFAPGQGSDSVYLLAGIALARIEADNTLSLISTINAADLGGREALTGGIDSTSGVPFFYAFFEPGGGAEVFRSVDAGATWQARGTVPSASYIRVAPGTSSHDPNLVLYGGVDLYRSADGGMTFNPVNEWFDYYSDISTKLHGDINFVKTFDDGHGNDVFLIGTDGGLYESRDGLLSVTNLSTNGFRQAQYYDSYTGRTPPYATSIGAQDQGYQFSKSPSSGVASYSQVISGDYGHLTSSDGGATVWMNYPTFTLVNAGAATATPALASFSFTTAGFRDMAFLAPLLADPDNPQAAWLGGGSANFGHEHVIALLRDPLTNTINATEGTYDFYGQVTALAVSPQSPREWYALSTNDTPGNIFYRSSNPASDWTLTSSGLPPASTFYGNMILPDPVRAGTLYVCGSGYSVPPVYVSSDDGTTFTPMSTGLPSTLVYAMAISPDGQNLFAATEVGPFYYERGSAAWIDLGAGAPDSIYWGVDYIPALHAARFSTHGRGLWDFDLGGGDLIFRDGYD